MEWKLFSEPEAEEVNEPEMAELSSGENNSGDDAGKIVAKTTNARRAIEILREQKQLEADTWDYLDSV